MFFLRPSEDGTSIDPDFALVDTNVSPRGAAVFLDGDRVGIAGEFDGKPDYMEIPSGSHVVELRSENRRTVRVLIHAQPGRLYDVRTAMQRGLPRDLQIIRMGEKDALREGGRNTRRERLASTARTPAPATGETRLEGFLVEPPGPDGSRGSLPASSSDEARAAPSRSDRTASSGSVGDLHRPAGGRSAPGTTAPFPGTSGSSSLEEAQSTHRGTPFAVVQPTLNDATSKHASSGSPEGAEENSPPGRVIGADGPSTRKTPPEHELIPPVLPGPSIQRHVPLSSGIPVSLPNTKDQGPGGLIASNPPRVILRTFPPDAGVFFDGVFLGSANAPGVQGGFQVRRGRHEIRVMSPGYKDSTDTFIIVDGETREIVIALDPLEEKRATEP